MITNLIGAAEAVFLLHALVASGTAIHAVLHSSDPRAAWGWIAICALAPLVGPLLYLMLGTNRIAAETRARPDVTTRKISSPTPKLTHVIDEELSELVRIGDATTGRPLTAGNRIEILHNGDEAYPAMLRAINGARKRVWMSSYIFRGDNTGRAFADVLASARARGIDVRVLVDAVGDWYYWPRGSRLLSRLGIDVRRFHLSREFLPLPHLNLRNHRKLLLVDDHMAFTGGLNIGDNHWKGGAVKPALDVHFQIEGPIAVQMRDVFQEDWTIAGGQPATVDRSLASPCMPQSTSYCRVVTEGPQEELDRLELILMGALANAHRKVSVVTPYFVPMPVLSRALEAAALRGVEVMIILPQSSNLPWVDWACRHWLRTLLVRGVRVFLQPSFVHAKLFIVDGYYSQVGSANLDARSLKLNFELNVEVFGRELGEQLQAHADELQKTSRELHLEELNKEGAARRLRNAAFWLLSAYL